MKKALTSGLVLLILGIVCGAILGVVNYFTSPIIEARIQAEKYAALEEMGITIGDYTVTEVEDVTAQIDKTIQLKQGSDLKIAVYSVTTSGYASGLNLLIAIGSDMKVIGYKVITHAETPGIGETALATHDYKMVGAVLPDISGFDAVSSPTAPLTNAGVLTCFTLVAAQAAIDFGGAD